MKRLVLSFAALAGFGLFAAPANAGGPCHRHYHVAHYGYNRCAAPCVAPAPVVETYAAPAAPVVVENCWHRDWRCHEHYARHWRHCR